MAKSAAAQQKDWQKEDDARVLAEAKHMRVQLPLRGPSYNTKE